MESKKNPKSDVSRNGSIYFAVGLALMLFLTYTTINYKTYDKSLIDIGQLDLDADLDEDELDTDDLDANLDEEDEDAELQQKFRLTARNGEDFVTITYKKEIEEGETTLKFSMYEYKNAVEREMEMKISHEQDTLRMDGWIDGYKHVTITNIHTVEPL
mgnify:CR=1 FL=1